MPYTSLALWWKIRILNRADQTHLACKVFTRCLHTHTHIYINISVILVSCRSNASVMNSGYKVYFIHNSMSQIVVIGLAKLRVQKMFYSSVTGYLNIEKSSRLRNILSATCKIKLVSDRYKTCFKQIVALRAAT